MKKRDGMTRRNLLRMVPGLVFPWGIVSCGGMENGFLKDRKKINKDVHWTRRKKWKGPEIVFGVTQFGDLTLMVQRTDQLGWAFPGGDVIERQYGVKNEKNTDLIAAIVDYVMLQSNVAVISDNATVFAYGYAIDDFKDRLVMAHWLNLSPASSFPPVPHPNMRTVSDARWVTLEDEKLGRYYQTRIEETIAVGEGGTIILHSCR